jgi:2,5-furandicarboxylate decarboxylase 1
MQDLRTFLSTLSEKDPGQIFVVKDAIDCRYEVTAVMEKLAGVGKYPALLFENARNLKGELGHRLLANVYGDRRRFSPILNLPLTDYKMGPVLAVLRAIDNPIAPRTIGRDEAPVRQVIKTGKEVDLTSLPIPIHWELDGGPFLAQPVLTKDPDTNVYNMAFHRAMVREKNETGLLLGEYSHNYLNYLKHEEKGESCPVAIVAGHHPAFGLAAYARLSKDHDHLKLAGALLGEPLRMVESETWGKDLLVPADAELVVEGEILPKVRKEEGPFGEWLGYSTVKTSSPVVRVTAITSRQNPILNTVHAGRPSDHVMLSIMDSAVMYRRVRQVSPLVTAINMPIGGCGRLVVYASMKKIVEGEQKNIALTLATEKSKVVVVVDEDIDVYDEKQVLWAIATRMQAGRDVEIIRGTRGTPLDPSIYDPPTHDVMIIDATIHLDRRFHSVSKVPDAVMKRVSIPNL